MRNRRRAAYVCSACAVVSHSWTVVPAAARPGPAVLQVDGEDLGEVRVG